MNKSENLISLSDSGAGPSLSISSSSFINSPLPPIPPVPTFGRIHAARTKRATEETASSEQADNDGDNDNNENSHSFMSISNRSGMLIDLTEAVQIPLPPAILTQAEVDDTFGIFSQNSQASQETRNTEESKNDKVSDNNVSIDGDVASKLIQSFTSTSTTTTTVTSASKTENSLDNNEEPEEGESEPGLEGGAATSRESDSAAETTCESDKSTVVESDMSLDLPSPVVSVNDVSIEKKKRNLLELEEKVSGSSYSAGSESELLDVDNLSSFSIPEADMSENEFLTNIRQDEMADAASTSGIIGRIRQELEDAKFDMKFPVEEEQEQDEEHVPEKPSSSAAPVSVPEISSTNPMKSSSKACRISTSSRLSSASVSSTTSNGSDNEAANNAQFSRRPRLSGLVGSPIRASSKFHTHFMPTPKAKTPAASTKYNFHRDRLNESLNSPSRTRVMLMTGNGHRSPSNMPVRKSISAETLHYTKSPGRGDTTRTMVKFSTPSSSAKPRRSYTIHAERNALYPNRGFTVKDYMNQEFDVGNATVTMDYADEAFAKPRTNRLSTASTDSGASTRTLSPPNNCTRDISHLAQQMKIMKLDQTSEDANSTVIFETHGARASAPQTAAVQPMRATAVIHPANRSAADSNVVRKPKLTVASCTTATSTGQPKFIPPVAASSPKIAPPPSPSSRTATTPSRLRHSVGARSSGYGQHNLNSTFGAKPPLTTSPNKVVPEMLSTTTAPAKIKPPAIPKAGNKGGLPTLTGRTGGLPKPSGIASSAVRSGIAAPKISKLPNAAAGTAPQSGLRRPGSVSALNKENNATRTAANNSMRYGVARQMRQ